MVHLLVEWVAGMGPHHQVATAVRLRAVLPGMGLLARLGMRLLGMGLSLGSVLRCNMHLR
jgi:hypothetical protein